MSKGRVLQLSACGGVVKAGVGGRAVELAAEASVVREHVQRDVPQLGQVAQIQGGGVSVPLQSEHA